MKPGVPKPAPIESALKVVEKRLAAANKRINTMAARAMKAGDYDAAQQWMETGKLVADFASRAGAFATEWRRVVRASRISKQAPEDDTGPASDPER